eukprot:gene17790-19567_t
MEKQWILIQRNTVKTVSSQPFNQKLSRYKDGFGGTNDDYYWIGLNKLHRLSSSNAGARLNIKYRIYSATSKTYGIHYETFAVGENSDKYKLKIDGFSGDGEDLMSMHNGSKFYTQSNHWGSPCYKSNLGGWWFAFTKCSKSLNLVSRSREENQLDLSFSEMKIQIK